MHLLLSVVLYAPGLLVFMYTRSTHTHDICLNIKEKTVIFLVLMAAFPATWVLVK
jgi:arginine:ornithine antiporter/lysine permease